nr:hypothetical protein [Tanacetum cinerariifolium]
GCHCKCSPATISVPTGSDVVSTASPIFTTATVTTPYTRRKGKENMVKSETPKKKKLQEQMDVQMARHLEQESAKKVKTLEEVLEENLKQMMHLVPVEEVYVEALQEELWVELKRLYGPDVEDLPWTHTQNMMHAPVEWKLYDTCGVHHVISKDQEMFMLVEKDYPLRKGLAIVMISYKLQVENYSQMANDLILKIHKIANSPRQQDD